jgi:hypothetical protein
MGSEATPEVAQNLATYLRLAKLYENIAATYREGRLHGPANDAEARKGVCAFLGCMLSFQLEAQRGDPALSKATCLALSLVAMLVSASISPSVSQEIRIAPLPEPPPPIRLPLPPVLPNPIYTLQPALPPMATPPPAVATPAAPAPSQPVEQPPSTAQTPPDTTPTTPSVDTTPTDQQTTVKQSPLLWAYGWTADQASKCDISDAVRQSCSGPNCLLSCLADACPGQENATCEFVIDCAAEITADVVAGDQQCDQQSIEYTTVQSEGGPVTVNVVKIAAGESCKPPPCAK